MNSCFPLRDIPVQPPFAFTSASSSPTRTKRVLVLDEDGVTRSLTALLLARAGYTVDTAEDGEAGWDALVSRHYDLLVTDNNMPRLTGLELTERLRLAGLTLAVILASGSLHLGEVEDYPWLALTAVLHKPFAPAELVAAARRVLPIAPDPEAGVVHRLEPLGDRTVVVPLSARTDAHGSFRRKCEPNPTNPIL